MTMHLMGHAYSTTRHRKLKPKFTKTNLARWSQEMTQYNKRARQRGEHTLTLDQYIDYVHGKGLPPKPKAFEPLQRSGPVRRDEGVVYRSASDRVTPTSTALPERKEYTGDLIAGIATLHKSNAVPVMKGTDEAKDIARMRRG